MDALLMCGGEGTRLDVDPEKPRVEIAGTPMVDRVTSALAASRIETTIAVVSPATPATRDHLDVPTIDAPGDGYVADLQYALDRVDRPVLTVAADLPLLAGDLVDAVLDRYESEPATPSLAVCVPAALKRAIGTSVDTTRQGDDRALAPTGVNVIGTDTSESEATMLSWDARLAVNVNRPSDVAIAEDLA